MLNTSVRMWLSALALCPVLMTCSTVPPPHTSSAGTHPVPAGPQDLAHFVLVIRAAQDGRLVHEWLLANNFDPTQFLSQESAPPERGSSARGMAGRIVLAAWNRDCEQERNTCEDNCMSSDLGPNWSHIKTRGAKSTECRNRCWRPYLDCCRLRDLEGEDLRAVDDAVDWLKRHRNELLVGTSIVIPGVAFVMVAGTGGGVLLLVPAVFLSSSTVSPASPTAAVEP